MIGRCNKEISRAHISLAWCPEFGLGNRVKTSPHYGVNTACHSGFTLFVQAELSIYAFLDKFIFVQRLGDKAPNLWDLLLRIFTTRIRWTTSSALGHIVLRCQQDHNLSAEHRTCRKWH